ncbi:ComEC/Rec2 family competence protein [Campylobacter mucosalis]|nr:ComEC/Rec2 family competence protein [Campylobacter mucosalis]
MKLFYTPKELMLFWLFIFALFFVNLFSEFLRYSDFMDAGEQDIKAVVLRSYVKQNKGLPYSVLYLKSENFSFYTTSRSKFKQNDYLNLTIHSVDVKFLDFISNKFYMPTSYVKIEPYKHSPTLRDSLISAINSQHQNAKISELYSALFLADSISKELRDDVTLLGVSHLVAISGYHLGVIFSLIFLLLTPILRPLYQKFCPWRDYKFDIFILAFVICVFYFLLLGFVPSFLRAFCMAVFGFFMLLRGIKILNFQTLSTCVGICIALFPSLLFNIGFYLSCMGVFYIFIYLKYFKDRFGFMAHSVFLNFYLFFVMQIPVLFFFPIISFAQFLVIPASYAFIIFYPASLVFHLAGFGSVFDDLLLKFLNFKAEFISVDIKFYEFLMFNALSILAIKFRLIAVILPIFGILKFALLV